VGTPNFSINCLAWYSWMFIAEALTVPERDDSVKRKKGAPPPLFATLGP
jgi:hypothetical protein